MRVILFLCFAIFSTSCLAQQGYSVIYVYNQDRYFPVTFNGESRRLPDIRDRLIFDDSLSFCYRIMPDIKDPLKKATVIGEKIIHHAMIFNPATGYYYSEVAWPKGRPEMLIRDSLKDEDWIFPAGTKNIKGYSCRSALHVSDKNDSTQVWFTDEIPRAFGPYMYLGFPGLVMEVIDQRFSQHVIVIKVEKGEYRVVMPKEVPVVSADEYLKLNSGKKGN